MHAFSDQEGCSKLKPFSLKSTLKSELNISKTQTLVESSIAGKTQNGQQSLHLRPSAKKKQTNLETKLTTNKKLTNKLLNKDFNETKSQMHSKDIPTSVVVNIGAESSSGANKIRLLSGNTNQIGRNKLSSEKDIVTQLSNDKSISKNLSSNKSKLLKNSATDKTNLYQNSQFEKGNPNEGARHRRNSTLSAIYSPQQRSGSSENYNYSSDPKIRQNCKGNIWNYSEDQKINDSICETRKYLAGSDESFRNFSSTESSNSSCNGSCSSDDGTSQSSSSSGEPNLPYPGFAEVAFKYLTQDTRPRNWCLLLITNPWFERVSIIVILLNCITLGMYQPCVDDKCESPRCRILQIFDDIIFAFFALEMSIKMVAMGMYGKNTYLADSWNRLDFFIVLMGLLEYVMHVENLNLTAIRTIRVLRPLRAINRIPSMRILVMLLLDTLPMLGNVLLLCFFVFFIFGIIGVQLWGGVLRQRCLLVLPLGTDLPNISFYYEFSKEQDYICSKPNDSGMHLCSDLPPYRVGSMICTEEAKSYHDNKPTNTSCVNWNQYYSRCEQSSFNPFQGTISFDNIGMAWVAIFLVISLEGWTDIMYYVQDAHSFWDWIYFVLLIVIGSFFMINLCLVVIATQFSETKKREMERMRQERARYTSSSTLASSTNNSEPATCYAEIVKYIAHLWRRFKRRMLKKYRLYKSQKQQRKELLPNADVLTFSPSRIKCHHPKCSKNRNLKKVSGSEQLMTVMVPLSSTIQHNKVTETACNVNNTNEPNVGCENNSVNINTVNSQNIVRSNFNSGDNSDLSSEFSTYDINSKYLKGTVMNKNQNTIATITNQICAESDTLSNKYHQQHQRTILLKMPSNINDTEQLILQLGNLGKSQPCNSGFLSPPSSASRRPSVMFNEYVLLHTPSISHENNTNEKHTFSTEKTTQTGDGNIWQVNLPQPLTSTGVPYADCSELGVHDAMTCQELLAFSVAFSAVLPTGQSTLDSFYSSLSRSHLGTEKSLSPYETINSKSLMPVKSQNGKEYNKVICSGPDLSGNFIEDYSCCYDLYQNSLSPLEEKKDYSKGLLSCIRAYRCISNICTAIRQYIKCIVEHKYFQQGILLAILINTLSMGIEYHKQPEILTAVVETSNIVFSGIFAVEMLLKVISEGPFRYIANGFNVFDGVIVILSAIEICQQYIGNGGGGGASGLSVLRTFRLLRILKLVRFMPNLRRQLFVMLRTMDNVAVFFSLLVLFIFIFSILGMNLFGCKFCENNDGEPPVCDRKNFDSLLWALVTVFQILTQEDWNVVLFNGMEKTSHWAALYFVALMTFGNYVLFNLLVAILVEGFGSERNERREREQRELVKKLREETLAENYSDILRDESKSDEDSSTTNDSFYEIRHRCRSADDFRKFQIPSEIIDDSKNEICLKKSINKEDHKVSRTKASDSSKTSLRETRMIKKVNSVKEKRSDITQLSQISAFREPPIITTTAATPQDSPNTTLDHGIDFQSWENDKECIGNLTYLKPPMLFNGQRVLEEGIPTVDVSPSIRKPMNILNASHLGNNTSASLQAPVPAHLLTEHLPQPLSTDIMSPVSQITETSSNDKKSQNYLTNTKRSKRTSSKRKKNISDLTAHNNVIQQSNLNDNSYFLDSTNSLIQGNHSQYQILGNQSRFPKVRNGKRRSSACLFTTPLNKNPNQPTNRNLNNRRMSSVELTFSKTANLNTQILDLSRKSVSYSSSKTDLDKYSNANELDILQQYIDAREKRKSSMSHQNIKIFSKDHSDLNKQDKTSETVSKLKLLINRLHLNDFFAERETYSLYIFSESVKFRRICTWLVNQKWFDNVVLLFIALNCITLAMERPNIPPDSPERLFLSTANYVFTVAFTVEMFIKVVATGMFYGNDAYFTSGWNLMDGSLVMISIIDLLMSLISQSSPRIFGILRVFRLLRSLRPLRVINRAPGLKLVVQTLLSSLRPIGNIVLICCTFFIIFGILGVQLFKGTFYYCEGENIKNVRNKTDCLEHPGNAWVNRKYNFDDLGKALMSLFVLSSRDGWVNIMYTGLDAVGEDQQPIVNYNEWRLLYFIAFILLVGFFVLNMFVGVVVENFHRCREEQEKEEKIRRAAKRALQMEKKRRRMHEPPYYTNYSPTRMFVHNVVTSKYFDLAIAAVIGLNVVTMAMEYYRMPGALQYALKIFNYFFTAVFILEANMKLVALGVRLYLKDKWNQLDVGIVILSVVGIVLEELETKIIRINPTIIRVMRVMRIARVLKLLKMAKGIRALLDTVMQALPQVGNLGLLFFLLFFIFAALGVELFGRLECSDEIPCQGLGEHAHFANFGMAFLTLFRVATGDNWNGIMKDTLRDNCDDTTDCVRNCCVSSVIAPIFFVIFVLMAQFVLVNVVVAVLMKHLEESHKQMEDEMDMEVELERELVREQELQQEQKLCQQLQNEAAFATAPRLLNKVRSLPINFTYSTPSLDKKYQNSTMSTGIRRSNMQTMNQTNLDLTEMELFKTQNTLFPSTPSSVVDKNNINKLRNLPQRGRRASTSIRKRAFLYKEQSLDEQALRHRNLEAKRSSYDSLPCAADSHEIKSGQTFVNPKQINLLLNSESSTTQNERNTGEKAAEACLSSKNKNTYRRSLSSDQGQKSARSLLAVPRSLVSHSRGNSTKQLFKQQALDEDQDIDEKSLLLPDTATQTTLNDSNQLMKREISQGVINTDSSDILRIISERRRMDQLENFGNEDSDYKELLLFKSSLSSSNVLN